MTLPSAGLAAGADADDPPTDAPAVKAAVIICKGMIDDGLFKSIRLGKVSLVESYCHFQKNELYIRGLQIAEYAWASYNSHEPGRERKLLMNRKELNKLERKVKESGLTIVALRIFISDSGYAKLEIALARGLKKYDKRG